MEQYVGVLVPPANLHRTRCASKAAGSCKACLLVLPCAFCVDRSSVHGTCEQGHEPPLLPRPWHPWLTASLPPVDISISVVELTTQHGSIRIRLRPDWSDTSVEYVRRVAMNRGLCTPQCEFYRAEPGFLLQVGRVIKRFGSIMADASIQTIVNISAAHLRRIISWVADTTNCYAWCASSRTRQGSLRAFIPPNNQTKPGPKFMERGEIGWAGGSAGPDWFIYLGATPATHWGHDHTVWGVIADEESIKVVEKIVMMPAAAPKPGDMHMMVEREPFDIRVASSVAAQ